MGRGRPPAGRGGRATATRGGPPSRGTGGPARLRTQRRRRRLKVLLGLVAGAFLLLGVFVGVVYATTEVPDPDSVQNAQTTVVHYSDGTTEMARLGAENRTNVPIGEVSPQARNAVLAAENRSFYTDPGISATGILRAAWNNLTGGSTQGGSTITQQYVGLSFLDNDATYQGKFQELFLAVKLDNTATKDEILESYLNAIYFGRGAYGIEAAATTYFGVPASQLTAQQGAVLAVLVRNPTVYDPENNPEGAQDRWGLVLDGMVEEGWLTQQERDASVYPPVLPRTGTNLGIPSGPEGLVVQRAIAELEAKGYDEQQLRAGGLRITTTVDKRYQDAAISSVAEVMEGQPDPLREALVAIDPRTGAVRAYYGGPTGSGDGAVDYAQALRQPGSSVKPYVLATALEDGIGVTARRDGSSPKTFPDRPQPVTNSGGASCGACTLMEAMTRSLNTTYYGLAYEVGADRVRQNVLEATGLPETWPADPSFGSLAGKNTLADPETGGTGASIGIGQYEMRPIDQAHGFATLANEGVEHEPFFVSRVTDTQGAVLLDYDGDAGDRVLEADVVNDTTYAMTDVAAYSRRSLDGGREVASKTGTQGRGADNSDAWMVGFTPSLSTAVWMGNDSPADPIEDASGRIVYGSGLPGAIWQTFMDTVLADTPEEDLPDRALIRGDTGEGVPEPAPRTRAPDPVTAQPTRPSAPSTQSSAPRTQSSAPRTQSSAPQTQSSAPPSAPAGRSTAAEAPDVAGGRPADPATGTEGAADPSEGQSPTR
ncbi:Membrane carboxypeptidase (penicillin-binding protein) [Geodermatophilus pulveris]|uniref:Membrane carboxypeptidase (Penicillin-binding protein) n=1 Tax=Geodermatophilus pulveris TaxID=1564159 RepID=A0A239FPG0_9ACTN|nr:Membrane carboxypeptidase (penicillin-binding protein) [Geodermatophilus pulveris]